MSTSWTVYRQDDNGNQFVVKRCATEEEARQLVASMTALGHKQVYWCERDGA